MEAMTPALSSKFPPHQSGQPTVAQITAIVDGARWAPSGDNVQPFSFQWDGTTLLIYEDAKRSHAFINTGNTASQMALGMCLANIEIAAEQWGWVPRWTAGAPGESVAQVTFEQGLVRDSSLAAALRARTVDRRAYREDLISDRFAEELLGQTENLWGIQFHLLDQPDQVKTLARINSGFESFLLGHKRMHADLFRWLRWSDADTERTQDGMPVSTLGLNPLDALSLRLLARWSVARLFNVLGFTKLAALRAKRIYSRSAAFGAFSITNTDPLTYVRVGWLWQLMWLKLTSERWSLQPIMGHVLMAHRCKAFQGEGLTENERNRFEREAESLRDVMGVPQHQTIACLFRIGRSLTPVPARAPRRSLSSLLRFQNDK